MTSETAPDLPEADAESPSSTGSPETLRPSGHSWLRTVCLFITLLFLAGLLAAQHIASTTLPHILQPGNGVNFQEVSDGLPVPRSLDWDQGMIEWLSAVRDAHGVPWFLLLGLLGGMALLMVLSHFNPAFRLVTLHRERSAHLSLRVAWRQLGCAFFLVLPMALVVAAVWLLTARLLPTSRLNVSGMALVVWLVRFVAVGMGLWIFFRPEGTTEQPATTTIPTSRPGAYVLRGAVFGLLLYLLVRLCLPPPITQDLLLRYHTLGSFHIGYWQEIAGGVLISVSLCVTACGALLCVLGTTGVTARVRAGLVLLIVVAVVGSIRAQRPLRHSTLADYDVTPLALASIRFPYSPRRPAGGVPGGDAAAADMARQAGLPTGEKTFLPPRNILFFFRTHIGTVVQQGMTEDGLTLDPATATGIRGFLQRRDYRSAYSWMAIKHLFVLGAYRFDAGAAMEACLLDMEQAPHLAQCSQTVRSMLFTCAASSANQALLDRWADDRHFVHPTRECRRLMGDLYRRFGAVEKAMAWYRRADMPRSFLARVRAEKPLFHQGHVKGVLRLNGRPLAGVQVGVIPLRLNGLPSDMEAMLFESSRELEAAYSFSRRFPAWHPRPFAFRWISASAVTDAKGTFILNNLTEGDYRLVCALPPNVKLEPPTDPALQVTNAPVEILLNYQTPSHDLGTIELTYQK